MYCGTHNLVDLMRVWRRPDGDMLLLSLNICGGQALADGAYCGS
jgi:hypothetical protein